MFPELPRGDMGTHTAHAQHPPTMVTQLSLSPKSTLSNPSTSPLAGSLLRRTTRLLPRPAIHRQATRARPRHPLRPLCSTLQKAKEDCSQNRKGTSHTTNAPLPTPPAPRRPQHPKPLCPLPSHIPQALARRPHLPLEPGVLLHHDAQIRVYQRGCQQRSGWSER